VGARRAVGRVRAGGAQAAGRALAGGGAGRDGARACWAAGAGRVGVRGTGAAAWAASEGGSAWASTRAKQLGRGKVQRRGKQPVSPFIYLFIFFLLFLFENMI
jgi:hypothetical protein